MPDFLRAFTTGGPAVAPHEVAIRLAAALVLGWVVAWIYRRTRAPADVTPSFPVTLVLLSILIAMVTQVIGDNVARAFSLVGALAIVRFRTVVRDTQDTAYVIFAVVVGMAVGANDPWVAMIGIGIVAVAAFLMRGPRTAPAGPATGCTVTLRLGLGHDLEALVGPTLDRFLAGRELRSLATARQGLAIEAVFEGRLIEAGAADELVKSLNRLDGVQNVEFERRRVEEVWP